jgi:hypothetical protein
MLYITIPFFIIFHAIVEIEVPLTSHFNFVQDVNYYNKLEDPTDEENDMLDLAFGLTET